MKKLSIITAGIILGASTLFGSMDESSLSACKGCHGLNFEKSALGTSKVVKDMSLDQIKESLIGYKNDTYGRTMKNIMKSQVSKYSDEQLEELAKMIYNINHKEEPEIKTGLPNVEKPSIEKEEMSTIQPVTSKERKEISRLIRIPEKYINFVGKVKNSIPGYTEYRLTLQNDPIIKLIFKDRNGYYIFGDIVTPNGVSLTKTISQELNKDIRAKMEKETREKLKNVYNEVLNGKYKELAVKVKGFKDDGETLVVFSDPKCPYCIRFENDVLPRMTKDYKEIYIVMFPLTSLKGHETSMDRSIWALTREDQRDGMKIVYDSSNLPYDVIKKDLEKLGKEKYETVKKKIEEFQSSNSGVKGTPTVINSEGQNVVRQLFQKYSK